MVEQQAVQPDATWLEPEPSVCIDDRVGPARDDRQWPFLDINLNGSCRAAIRQCSLQPRACCILSAALAGVWWHSQDRWTA